MLYWQTNYFTWLQDSLYVPSNLIRLTHKVTEFCLKDRRCARFNQMHAHFSEKNQLTWITVWCIRLMMILHCIKIREGMTDWFGNSRTHYLSKWFTVMVKILKSRMKSQVKWSRKSNLAPWIIRYIRQRFHLGLYYTYKLYIFICWT